MADSDVVEAEATSNTEAGAGVTAKTPAVAAKPQEAGAKTASEKPETKVAEKTEAKAKPDASKDAKDAVKPAETETEQTELVFRTKEGEPIKGPVIEAFTAMANEQKWTPEIADKQHERLSKAMGEARAALFAGWEKELRSDKEFGGDKFDESLGQVRKAVEAIGGADTWKSLEKSGLALEPSIARLLQQVWKKAVGPDGFTAGVRATGRPGDIPNPNDTSVAAFAETFKPATPSK